ncbi:dimethyl sulfoxide reductase anchor subunit [Vibrio lentus]|nr:dimethyl sulfoxide reductase anchor subunit [Vibrio lentus]
MIFFYGAESANCGWWLLTDWRTRTEYFGHDEEKLNSYKVPMFILWALMGLGFMFSTTHLGSPLRAFNAFNQLGSAWLSNEVFFGAAFFAVGGLQWLLSVVKKGGIAIQKALDGFGAMVLGVIFVAR